MIALIRYTAAITLHSQRYLPATLLFVVSTGVLATGVNPGPVVPLFAPMTGVAFLCAAWLTVTLVNLEHPVQRVITVVNVGRSRSLLIAVIWVVLAISTLLAALGIAVLVLLVYDRPTALDVAAGAEAMLTGSCSGIALGMLTSRLVVRRAGYSLLAALILAVILVVVPGIPPLNPLIRLLANTQTVTTSMFVRTTIYAAVAVVILVASTIVTQLIAARRD